MSKSLCTLFLLCCALILFHSSKATNSSSSQELQISPGNTISPFSSSASHRPASNHNTKALNVIDSCWRSKPNWSSNRQSLADCAVGFGQGALGGREGKIYVVSDTSDDAMNPKQGTLRYGVIQQEALWIVFEKDMILTFQNELIIASNKTIDGRGAKVEITGGPCITIEHAKNIIIHGISIYGCRPGKPGLVRNTPTHHTRRRGSDGDGIKIINSSHIWIDHCFLSNCTDGLVDVIHASKDITVSNSRFTNHIKVMLLGHRDGYKADSTLRVTLAFNHFGPRLRERMPRIRYGYVHVVNNYYEPWLLYAIGGSSHPTILSEANYFIAPNEKEHKAVTKREVGAHNHDWKNWPWTSKNDVFMNGAHFDSSGMQNGPPAYSQPQAFVASPGSLVPQLVLDAGPLTCV